MAFEIIKNIFLNIAFFAAMLNHEKKISLRLWLDPEKKTKLLLSL